MRKLASTYWGLNYAASKPEAKQLINGRCRVFAVYSTCYDGGGGNSDIAEARLMLYTGGTDSTGTLTAEIPTLTKGDTGDIDAVMAIMELPAMGVLFEDGVYGVCLATQVMGFTILHSGGESA